MELLDVVEIVKELKQDMNKRFDKIDENLSKVVTTDQCKERMENNKVNLSSKQIIAIVTSVGGIIAAIIAAIKIK